MMRSSSIVRWSLVLLGGTGACLSIDDRTIVDGPSGGAGSGGDNAGGRAGAADGGAGFAGSNEAGEAGQADAGEAGTSAGGSSGSGPSAGKGGTGAVSGASAGGTAGSGGGSAGAGGKAGSGGNAGAGGTPSNCGNGVINSGETCDDSNNVASDGCTSCVPDHGYTCTGSPSVCVTTCGDGIVGGLETCDDGAKVAGNGCSATCTIEIGSGCWGEPSICSRSCSGMSQTACQTESCCERITITGGTVRRGRGDETCPTCTAGCPVASCVNVDSGSDTPEHNATVNQYLLDKYEITVGRFRRFADSYAGPPAVGAGAHPAIAGTGWQSAWNASMPSSAAALKTNINCSGTTWTTNAGSNEQLPMNCVNWYEAFAFCAWDGGRLPTESEWEFAAAGGSENRVFPWGGTALSASLAVYNCPAGCTNGFINMSVVGSKPSGAGRFGNRDLVGNVREWVFDYYAAYTTSLCNNCATTATGIGYRVIRGGGWRDTSAKVLRSADRLIAELFSPTQRQDGLGFRCARTP